MPPRSLAARSPRPRAGDAPLSANAPLSAAAAVAVSLLALIPLLPLLLAGFAGCDGDLGLVDPPAMFRFDPANAWPTSCSSRTAGSDETPPSPGVPPPPGLVIAACPNPAPPGTTEIAIEFRLETRVPGVNLAIVNSRGEIVHVLMRDRLVEVDRLIRAIWLLDGVPPGDYRAYFRGGSLETFGDLQVQ